MWKGMLVTAALQSLYEDLNANGVRVVLDDRDDKTPGYKFNHWVGYYYFHILLHLIVAYAFLTGGHLPVLENTVSSSIYIPPILGYDHYIYILKVNQDGCRRYA